MQLDTRRLDARITEADAALAQQQAALAELVRGPRKEQIAAARASLQAASSDRAFRKLELQRADDLLARKLAVARRGRPGTRRVRQRAGAGRVADRAPR